MWWLKRPGYTALTHRTICNCCLPFLFSVVRGPCWIVVATKAIWTVAWATFPQAAILDGFWDREDVLAVSAPYMNSQQDIPHTHDWFERPSLKIHLQSLMNANWERNSKDCFPFSLCCWRFCRWWIAHFCHQLHARNKDSDLNLQIFAMSKSYVLIPDGARKPNALASSW